MDIMDSVKKYNEKHNLFKKGAKIIVGVSGGKDSVCLLHVLNELKEEMNLTLMVVHINHGIRGAAANTDAKFVVKMAQSLGLSYYLGEADVKEVARVKRISEEEAGRLVRYDTMEIVRLENQYDQIAIAHHQDDVAETVLFNLLRGTGPKGLSGISPKRDAIIRPILFMNSDEIEEYIKKKELPYREDHTNSVPVYTRNKIRLLVFPYLEKEINQKAKEHVAQAAERIAMQNRYIEKVAKAAYMKVVKSADERYAYEMKIFLKLELVIQVEVLRLILGNLIANSKDVDNSHYQMILGLEKKEVGKRIDLPEGVVATRTYDGVSFSVDRGEGEKVEERVRIHCDPPCECLVRWKGVKHRIQIRVCEKSEELGDVPKKGYTKWLDYDKIKSDILIRNPEKGDFLSIDQEGKRKRLSRYFIDEKVPAKQRENELVLAVKDHVIWVVSTGRISQKFMVTENTKNVLIIGIERV